MPNWTSTTLVLKGKRRDLEAFAKQAMGEDEDAHGKTDLTFQNFLPCPKELDEWNDGCKVYKSEEEKTEAYKKHEADLIARFGYSCAYDFHVEVWGTKWDACHVMKHDIEKTGKAFSLCYTFDTAWAPCEPVLIEISRQYPGLKITAEFEEEGGLFETYEATFFAGEKTGEVLIEREDEDEEDEDEDEEGDGLPAPETDPKNN